MIQNLLLTKVTSKFATALFGVAKVIVDRYGGIVSEVELPEYGLKTLKFRVVGASRKITRKDGYEMRKQQRCWCTVDKDDELAKIVQTLDYGDKIWLYGSLSKKAYIGENGKTRNTLFCSLMDLRIISKAEESQQRTAESVVTEYVEPDSDDFNGFDDL